MRTIPGDAATYAERVARHVPGLHDLHRMVDILLAEHLDDDGRLLVLGAGGGLELKAFAEQHLGWQFLGIDPSPEMLAQAGKTLGAHVDRVTFHHGYVDDAPEGPFDGATALLVLHFLPRAERLQTLCELHRRLRPGAPFVAVHHSFPQDDGADDLWLQRNAAWLMTGGLPEPQATAGIATMKEHLPALTPDGDAELLRAAGFRDVQPFYAAFTFKGWVARA